MSTFSVILSLFVATAAGAVELAGIFTDHMVLQCDRPVPVWGHGAAGATVTVEFAGQKQTGIVGADGRWQVILPPLRASAESRVLVVQSNEETARISDVLVGEVWLASGQSNMEWPLVKTLNASNVIAQAADQQLRLFTVPRRISETPATNVTGVWAVCTPARVADFSAVGYYFARDLRAARRVPVGIICAAWGGTPAQAWTSRSALERHPLLKKRITDHDQAIQNYDPVAAEANYQRALAEYEAAHSAGQPRLPAPAKPERPAPNRLSPARLYNGMIAPLVPLAFRGVIWYQGEADARRAHEYRVLFPALIRDWRDQFGHSFPFLFVQIAPFRQQPPEIRDAQLHAWRTVPGTMMVVTTDCGDAQDIHPRNKEPVGARLALAARAMAYGENVAAASPVFEKLEWDGPRAKLIFAHATGGLVARGETLTGFTIAGADRKFVPAQAVIAGPDTVIVSSAEVPQPVAVRFGWANVPVVNLFNQAGLPASPFRTDDW